MIASSQPLLTYLVANDKFSTTTRFSDSQEGTALGQLLDDDRFPVKKIASTTTINILFNRPAFVFGLFCNPNAEIDCEALSKCLC